MKKTSILLTSLILFISLTSFNPVNFNSNSKIFKIKEFEVSNVYYLNKDMFLNFLLKSFEDENLIKFKKEQIMLIINEFDIIDSIKIRKIYPSKIKIDVKEKKPIAILIKDKKTFYLTEENEIIGYFRHEKLEGLPNIIGNHENFFDLYKVLILNNFAINEVKSFYYFNIGRWDVILKDGKIIKLPPKNYESSIKNFNEMKFNNNLNKYSIFDYRIKDQLILN